MGKWTAERPLNDRRVLVVAAHPDDEVLGMGATIANFAQRGAEITVLWVTDGSSTQYPGDVAIQERKLREAVMAAKSLGVQRCVQGDLPDMRLDSLPHVEVNRVVEEAVEEFAPDTVYCVHPDVNSDHRAVFNSVLVATRPRVGGCVRQVLTYATSSGIEWSASFEHTFRPTWFSNVSATIQEKVAAFDYYTTEQRSWPHPRSARAITATAQYWGTWAGWTHAEPFVLIRNLD
jgi:LmbE family N-acetylglucosaminyl deacetylase